MDNLVGVVSFPSQRPEDMAGIGTPPCLNIGRGTSGWRVTCVQRISRGDAVLPICGRPTSGPDRYSIQLREGLHLTPDGAPWALVNHSCDANLAIDFSRWQLVAHRDIVVDEEVTWNYLTTEWELQSPFHCQCGASSCVQHLRGFRHLTARQRHALACLLSPFLRSQIGIGVPREEHSQCPE